MKKNFNEKEFTIVSQSFQNERAIFIANHYGLDAIGYNARDINIKKGYRVYFREVFARVKVFADILKSKIWTPNKLKRTTFLHKISLFNLFYVNLYLHK